MVAQAGELTPRLPAVRRPEHRRVLDAGVDRVGIGERRLEVPDSRELEGPLRAVVPEVIADRALVRELVADRLPALAAVAGALDHLTEPAAGLRGVEPVRVGGRALEVIDLPPSEMGAAHVPVPARAVRGQDERALASADQYAYTTHGLLLSSLSLRRGFRRRLHAGQALLELAAEGLVHVHEEEDGPADETVVPVHAPRHGGPLALGPERELSGVGRLER